MPELPEVETVRRALGDATTGAVIASVRRSAKPMRWPIPRRLPALLTGATIRGWRRRGKYLLADCMGGDGKAHVLLLHLGMSGRVRLEAGEAHRPRRHDHLTLALTLPATKAKRNAVAPLYMVLNDARRFGGADCMRPEDEANHRLLKSLGIEPCGSNTLDGAFLARAFAGKTCSIKSALLDQRIIAGIGNIYASEALFEAGIAPARAAGSISKKRLSRLAEAIGDVLSRAIAAGGTTLRDHIAPDGALGYFAMQLKVYGREGEACPSCRATIRMLRQTGRASFYCPRCQR